MALSGEANVITCTVHERDNGEADIAARADAIVFVREGIAWWALVFPILWLLYHRLWLMVLLYLVVMLALTGVMTILELPELIGGVATMLVSFLLALEGNDLRRWTLARKGFAQVDVTTGRDRQECEQRFFEDWLPRQGAHERQLRVLRAGSGADSKPDNGADDVIGLFPEAGR